MITKKASSKDISAILNKKNVSIIVIAFTIVFLFYLLPTPEGLTQNGKIMIGILIMGGILWISEPIPLAVTGLLIMIIQPLFGVREPTAVFSSFGNQAVFFLIGAFILASAIEKHGVHRRIALTFLKFFEFSPRIFTLGIMCACAFLSFIMPEHGVAALFLPIVASILIAMKVIPKQSNFGKISMLSVAYGCSIGSLGTLIGGARNPLTVAALSNVGITVTFVDWMVYAMPVVFVSLPIVWIVLQFSFPIEIKDITLAKKEINNQVAVTGKISTQGRMVLVVLIVTIILWVFFSSTPYIGLAVIAILASVLLFLLGTITWRDIEERVPWGIILLYGGAITLGIGMQETGAGSWVAQQLFILVGSDVYILIFMLIVITVLLTNVMSNVGAVAILLPIGLAVATEVPGISPLLASMIVALSGGLAFMLVIATPGNAITYSSGYFSTRDLFKAGSLANLLCIGIIFLIAIFYWMGVLHLEQII